jgi:GH43 family beta-xylosidase
MEGVRKIHYRNPVHDDYFADPFVWSADGEYYAIGTGRGDVGEIDRARREPTVFPLLRSSNLVDWRPVGRALVQPHPALGSTFWAPEVACQGGTWFLYYSVGHDDRGHQLRVATSDAPVGPYVDVTGLTSPDSCSFAIDPHPFRDDDGRWYLFHARDFLTAEHQGEAAVRAGTALVARAMVSMTELAAEEATIARARCDWQRFARDRLMYGRRFDWHTLEGPFVVKERGRYFCFFSGGCWNNDTYGVDYVVAESVMGPYSDTGVELGPRLLRTVPGRMVGPGHCSVVLGPDRRRRYVVYHAWDGGRTARRMCIDELAFSAEGPHCKGPSYTDQEIRVG